MKQPQQQLQQQQQIDAQPDNGSVLVPSSSSADSFDSNRAMLEAQQTQCQSDTVDIKPNVGAMSPNIKQELASPIGLQSQNTSPAGQVMSPRIAGKSQQSSQSKLLSPDNPSSSPRQGVKRTSSSSPVRRQVNRNDL
jgi:hypothetical protein